MKVLKKTILLLAGLVLTSSIVGCGNRENDYSVNNDNRIILRLAETQQPAYPSSRGVKEFARLVEEKSGGRIKVKVYDFGRLGDEASVNEQIQFGGIDLARVSVASLSRYSPKVNIVTLPYIFRSPEHEWRVFEGPIGADIRESLLKENITCLAWYEGGARGFYTTKKKINNVNDLKGLKISLQQSQMAINLYSTIGVSLVSTKASDIYSALQAGNLDGVEGNVVAYYISKHYEVAPYFTYDEHARIPEVIIGSRVTMLQLSPGDQALISQAAMESAVLQRKEWLEMEREALKALNGMGIIITYANDRSRESFMSVAKPFYNRFKKEDINALVEY